MTRSQINPEQSLRHDAMAVLAHASKARIAACLKALDIPSHEAARQPENGLVMVRGRIGGDGAPFNLGEASVSRAAVRLASGEVGFGYVLGRDGEKAKLIALCDALIQSNAFKDDVAGRDCAAATGADRGARQTGGGNSGDACRFLHAGERRKLIMTLHANLESGSGFANPVPSSQSVFRCVMNALARPGSVQTVTEVVNAPSLLMPAAAAVALTLFDHDTPIWIDERFAAGSDIAGWLRFQTGAPLTSEATRAAFALIHGGAPCTTSKPSRSGRPNIRIARRRW